MRGIRQIFAGRARRGLAAVGALAMLTVVSACARTAAAPTGPPAGTVPSAADANPNIDTGTSLGGRPAPNFRLVNQFGQPMSLSQFRGKVVLLAFTDSQCTTICPLTTAALLQAKALLGAAGQQVQLLGVDANPKATGVASVLAYSRVHAMVNQWDFLTGSLSQLKAVWSAYHIYVQIQAGQIDHTPALFVIDQHGRERMIYLTMSAYDSVGQQAQVLATEISGLLPGHPKLASTRSLAAIAPIPPTQRFTAPTVGGGHVTLGPGRPRLVLFFASWLSETTDLAARLRMLNGYARAAAKSPALPPLVAINETVTEPSTGAVRTFLAGLGQRLDYPVALDTTGRLADGYKVTNQPWLMLTSSTGKIVWTAGDTGAWPT
ncbi:MAG: SCO family protein, partial [Streptosporangiaceae bacterium]